MAVFVLRYCVFCFCSSPDLPPVIASASPSRYTLPHPAELKFQLAFLKVATVTVLYICHPGALLAPWTEQDTHSRKTTKKSVQDRHTSIKYNIQMWYEMTAAMCMYCHTCLLMFNYLLYLILRTGVKSSTAVSQLYKKNMNGSASSGARNRA